MSYQRAVGRRSSRIRVSRRGRRWTWTVYAANGHVLCPNRRTFSSERDAKQNARTTAEAISAVILRHEGSWPK